MSTKTCSQCNKPHAKDEFSKNQWRKPKPTCRLCSEFTKLSQETSRVCHGCRRNVPRMEYSIYQWSKGNRALCHPCRDALDQKVLNSMEDDMCALGGIVGTTSSNGGASGGADSVEATKELPDGTIVCGPHSLESCDICMMDFSLPNQFARKRNEQGERDLTKDELDQVTKEWQSANNVHIPRKICILDGQPVCPRSGKKLRCECKEVTYCSVACQKHHWTIHKMTCKVHLEKKQKKAQAKAKKRAQAHAQARTTANVVSASASASAANELTEKQKDYVRMEAFLAENNGGEHSIEECAWQLGEHPLVIGGGTIRCNRDGSGEEFIQGDVAQIYKEKLGVEWDGSPRFGMGPYEQRKPPVDWIAKARQQGHGHGKTERMKDLERHLLGLEN